MRRAYVKVKFRGWRISGRIIADIYRVGLPAMVTNGIPALMLAVMNAILMPFSSTAVAFFGVYYKLQNFLLMPINGLGQACLPIISYNYGTKNLQRIRQVLRDSIPVTIIIALIAMAIFLIFPKGLLSLYSATPEMLAIGVPGLRITSITFSFACVTVVLGYCMSGLGNGVIMMIATLIRQFVVLIPLAYLFLRFIGINAAWYAFWPAEILAVVFTAIAAVFCQQKIPEIGRKIPCFRIMNSLFSEGYIFRCSLRRSALLNGYKLVVTTPSHYLTRVFSPAVGQFDS